MPSTPHESAATWAHFEHGADIGVRGVGDDPAEAFAQAARALTGVITDPDTVRDAVCVEIVCKEADTELLFVDWMNALIYEMATRRMLFSRFEVKIEGADLYARAWGEALEPGRHRPAVEIKGATYTELRVAPMPDGRWLAQCVVDV